MTSAQSEGIPPCAIRRGAVFPLLASLFAALVFAQPASAQSAAPDENVLARLVWSTMVALDNANRTGNYAVLHALGTEQFQASQPVERLAASFSQLRDNRVDVGRAILTAPTYYIPPSVDEAGRLRLRGGFDYRPKSIRFDILFENVGGWRIAAISVVEMDYDAPR